MQNQQHKKVGITATKYNFRSGTGILLNFWKRRFFVASQRKVNKMNNIELAAGICTGGIPDDRYQDSDYERNELFQERRQAQIESDATELMRTGNCCDPWTLEHITEACGQLDKEAFADSAEMCKFVYDYWLKAALYLAERNLKY